jgi:hypothetical protein
MRKSERIEWRGQFKTLTEWSEHLGISRWTLKSRLDCMPKDEAFTRPVDKSSGQYPGPRGIWFTWLAIREGTRRHV